MTNNGFEKLKEEDDDNVIDTITGDSKLETDNEILRIREGLQQSLNYEQNSEQKSFAFSDLDVEEDSNEDLPKENQKPKPPLYAWILLFLALFFVSSAATVLKFLQDVPPILRSSWRLQILSIILLPGVIMQWVKSSPEIRNQCLSRKTVLLVTISAFSLALHFATWIASLDWTSLPHSLLFVTITPLIIVAAKMIFCTKLFKQLMTPPTFAETFGAVVGVIGVGITLLDIRSDNNVTVIGDLAALIGALTFWAHIAAGGRLRSWMPLFIYTFPVTLLSTIFLIIASFLFEDIYWTTSSQHPITSTVFGWVNYPYILHILYLGFGPGLFGHTVINSVIKYMDAVIVTIFLLLEPVLGSIIGWVLGVTGVPGKYTWIGAPLIMASLIWVTAAESKKMKRINDKMEEYVKSLWKRIKSAFH